jgi:hypothetical protein
MEATRDPTATDQPPVLDTAKLTFVFQGIKAANSIPRPAPALRDSFAAVDAPAGTDSTSLTRSRYAPGRSVNHLVNVNEHAVERIVRYAAPAYEVEPCGAMHAMCIFGVEDARKIIELSLALIRHPAILTLLLADVQRAAPSAHPRHSGAQMPLGRLNSARPRLGRCAHPRGVWRGLGAGPLAVTNPRAGEDRGLPDLPLCLPLSPWRLRGATRQRPRMA